MRHFFVTIVIVLLSREVHAQGFRVRHPLPGVGTHLSKAIFEVSIGNYITGGLIVEPVNNAMTNRICIMGLDAQGQITWTKKYGNGQLEYLNNHLIARSYYKEGNYMYYTGCARDNINNANVGVLIKFDMFGDTVWQKIYRDSDPLEDVIPQMVTGSVDNGFLITGFFQNNNSSPYSKCMLIKTDASGNEIWRRKIAKLTPNTQDGQAIVQDLLTKKIVMVGYQYIGDANYWSPYDNVVVVDSLGQNPVRNKFTGYGGILKDVIRTSDNKIIAVGNVYSPQTLGGNNLQKSFAVKFDVNNPGTSIWQVVFDDLTLANIFSSLVELPNGDVLVAGIIDTMQINNLPTNSLVRLTKINPAGVVTWNRNYDYKINNSSDDNIIGPHSINLCSDGSFISAIECYYTPPSNPFFFVKFDSTGCDSTLIYCQSLLTTGTYKNTSLDVAVEIFPNPAKELLKITISSASLREYLTLTLTDLSGREVKTAIVSAGQSTINIKDLRDGTYIVKLEVGKEIVYINKIVKQE